MPKSDIVVIGASAGGVEALRVIAAGLPANLDAALFAVVHIGAGINGHSNLPAILNRAGRLPSKHPVDGETIQHRILYLAPPDCHMLLSGGKIHLSHGPRENRTRPAINPLFRSAAHAYRGRVAGVILTGLMDDGTAGLAEIKRRGGVTIAQDPVTAMHPEMPANAIAHIDVDHVAPLERIPGLIAELATTERGGLETEESLKRQLLEMACPECGGPIWQERQGSIVEFRCMVGHAYSPLAIASEHKEAVERALWGALVTLEQAAVLDEKLAPEVGEEAAQDAKKKREWAETIRGLLDGA